MMYEKISKFLSEKFHFLMVKFSVYLNRLVFIMIYTAFRPVRRELCMNNFFCLPFKLILCLCIKQQILECL